MSLTISQTKIHPPHYLSSSVKSQTDQTQRILHQEIITRLDTVAWGKVVALCSPNGTGKTTLIQSWLMPEIAAEATPATAWLTLDLGDNDPVRFLAGIIGAVQQIHPALGAAVLASLQMPRPPDVFIELSALLSEISHQQNEITLVLDDYELINSARIHQAVIFLAANLPENLHLVLACGAELPLELEEACQNEGWAKIDFQDLQLSEEEVIRIFELYSQDTIPTGKGTVLTHRTQGIVLAVQLAGLAFQHHPDPDSFWSGLAQQPAPALTFLVEQVLMLQTDAIREFLLCTSILGKLTGPLCDMVMRASLSGLQAEGRGRVTLEHLSRNRLLTLVQDPNRTWYRYQTEFTRLLKDQLSQRYPALLKPLHQRASSWHENNQDLEAAILHALAAKDEERASILIEVNILSLVGMGQLNTVLTWLGKISAGLILLRPWLSLAEAWAVAHEGWEQGVDTLLANVETATGAMPEAAAQRARGHMAAIRSQIPTGSQNTTRIEELYRQALELLPPQDRMIRCYITTQLGILLRQRGSLSAAAEAVTETVYCTNQGQDRAASILAYCLLIDLHLVQGLLQKVLALSEEALNQAEIHHIQAGYIYPQTGLAHIFAGIVLLERDELELAQSHLEQSLALCHAWGKLDALALGQAVLASVLNARGNIKAARDSAAAGMEQLMKLEVQKSHTPQRSGPLLALQPELIEAWLIRLQIFWGEYQSVRDWMERHRYEPDDSFGFERSPVYITLAFALLSLDRALDARRLVRRLIQQSENAGAAYTQVQALVLQAQLFQNAGDYSSALASLKRAFLLAESENMIRVFIDITNNSASADTAAMRMLIKKLSEDKSGSTYAKTILTSLERQLYRNTNAESLASVSANPITRMLPSIEESPGEPLSDREKQILRSLENYLSIIEIASELSLSHRTVDTIVRNIYRKLGVRDARQAVQRARELRII